MKAIRKIKKHIAVTLAVVFLNQLLAPAAAWALTSGPTAPEYTSFEPVDTTDMVNLQTGDFTYNLPLLEVPGPAGGYPLSLSYHAGIQPNEDASWVGLGWTLNPGAIHRTVNGYADDQDGATRSRTDHNNGGERHTLTVGLGYAGVASFGLAFSQDTYQGFGMGSYVSMGLSRDIGGKDIGIGAGVSATVSSDPYSGEISGSIGAGLNIGQAGNKAQGLSLSVGVSTNFNSVSVGAGVSFRDNGSGVSHSLLGASISSKGLKPSASVAGVSIQQINSNAGRWTTQSNGFQVSIPLPNGFSADFGHNYLRYYSHETSNVAVLGSLHANDIPGKNPDNWGFDSYALHDPANEEALVELDDPEMARGGSFPAYDQYSVMAQGLSGTIQPYLLKNTSLFRQNLKEPKENPQNPDVYILHYNNAINTPAYNKVNFRFNNDFSNAYTYPQNARMLVDNLNAISFENTNALVDPDGYNANENHLAGSKHIQWFTNQEIADGDAKDLGFIDYQPNGQRITIWSTPVIFSTEYNIAQQIGGYSITNESGVTYHYALPVYAYEEVSRNQNNDNSIWMRNDQEHPYAYTWLLTGITGPDFVDRGGENNTANGIMDENDWGYWVKLDYGKWAYDYQWRNPHTGMHKDLQQETEMYAYGKKELYYLNTISTATHTAIFVKEIRADGKGVTDLQGGGFEPIPIDPQEQIAIRPISTLRLNEVYLLKNEDYETLGGNNICQSDDTYIHSHLLDIDHMGHYIIDVHDITNIQDDLDQATIRKITLNTDYTLAPGTENSFFDYWSVGTDDEVNNKQGKLTLNSIEFAGKGGVRVTPPMYFTYDLEESASGVSVMVNGQEVTITDTDNVFKEGDIITYTYQGIDYYCTLVDETSPQHYKAHYLDNHVPNASQGSVSARVTKNPPYNKEFYDIWGLYKADYIDLADENVSHIVSTVSAQNTDAWSLRKIKTSLGADIEVRYESDSYSQVGVEISRPFLINSVNIASLEDKTVTLNCKDYGEGFYEKLLANIQHIDFQLGAAHMTNQGLVSIIIPFVIGDNGAEIVGVSGNAITVKAKNTIGFYLEGGVNKNLWGGNFTTNKRMHGMYGGGVRVEAITVNNVTASFQSTTRYNYQHPDQLHTSGNTSYEPFGMDVFDLNINNDIIESYVDPVYKESFYRNFFNLIHISRELPGPGVTYEYVTVTEEVTQNGQTYPLPGKKRFHFQVFENSMIYDALLQEDAPQNTCYVGCQIFVNNECQEQCPGNDPDCVQCDQLIEETWPCGENAQWSYAQVETICDQLLQNYNPDPNVMKPYPGVEVPLSPGSQVAPITLRDYSSRIGSLKSITTFDDYGRVISKTENLYLHDGLDEGAYRQQLAQNFNNQGVVTELFAEQRTVKKNNLYQNIQVFARKEEYPTVSIGQRTTDYKTGVVTESRNLAFDFYTGESTKVVATDGYGRHWLSESEPAYRQYPAMGMKVNNPANRHMLTQNAGSYVYRVDDPIALNKEALISAGVQTWSKATPVMIQGQKSDQAANNIWRKKAAYTWKGDDIGLGNDGLYPFNNYTPFDAWEGGDPSTEQWQKTGEITLYDLYSHALEARDINGHYVATKMSADQTQVYATAAPAAYHEFAFSGAEDDPVAGVFGGGVRMGQGSRRALADGYPVHTGQYSLAVSSANAPGFYYELSGNFDRNKKYVVSVWVQEDSRHNLVLSAYDDNVLFAEAELESDRYEGKAGWHRIQTIVDLSQTTGTIRFACQTANNTLTYMDDFRVHPLGAAMTAYVYNEYDELDCILNAQNLYTRYEYDATGRLRAIHGESFRYGEKKLSETSYNYARNLAPLAAEINTQGSYMNKTFSVAVSSGYPPYTYKWNIKAKTAINWGDPLVTETKSGTTSTYDPDMACGYYDVKCEVTDHYGRQQTLVGDLTPSAIGGLSLMGNNTGAINANLNFQATGVYGGCGNYTYTWRVDGNVVQSGEQSTLSRSFQNCGEHVVQCSVSDGGITLSSEMIVNINKDENNIPCQQ